MSASSGTTLISPSATSAISRVHAPQPQRKVSGHNAHAHGHGHAHHTSHASHAHHPKRKQSGPNAGRRGSEPEGGKRALAAGLAMHALDTAGDVKGKRRASADKPLKKSSRSDTHLPRLSRTTSINSNTSEQVRPKLKNRPHSGESIQIVSEDGTELVNGEDEEGWEESGDEDGPVQIRPPSLKGKGKAREVMEASTPMRRTQSETQAQQPPLRSRSITTSPLALQAVGSGDLVGSNGSGGSTASGRGLHPRQRTLGFAGPHAVGDPQTNAQRHINEVMPHWNDSMHVRPAHQVKHQKSLSALSAMQEGSGMQRSISGHGHGRGHEHESTRKGLSNGHESQDIEEEGQIQMNRSHGTSPKSSAAPPPPLPKNDTPKAPRNRYSAPPQADHHRLVSATETSHRLKHRASNSSMRSLQSLRAPPHPLNSPTGYRSGLPPSRSGSTTTSPAKDRGPSMHHPPIAPPVVYREVATGYGWDIPEDEEYSTPIVRSATLPNGPNGNVSPGPASAPLNRRQASVSSTKSLQGLLRPQPSPSSSTSSHPHHHGPRRRQTAVEQTTKAARYASTNDPVLYHHSLGHGATSAETAHLISRFLPQRRVSRPTWEISAENLDTHSGIGLSRGDYRDAHESLIRSMRELGAGQSVKTASRRLSYQSLLGTGRDVSTRTISLDGDGDGVGVSVGMVGGRNGPMVVARGGGWRGKTPFELSVERCLAQKPVRGLGA